jgi:hypothetical protein
MSEQNFSHAEFYKRFYDIWEKTLGEAFDIWAKSPFLKNAPSVEGDPNFNPNVYYKKFYDIWEKTTSEAVEMWLKTPLFASTVGKAVEQSSEFKRYVDQVMERSLKSLQLPTKGDIDKTLAAINKIEEKINDLIEKVEELSASQ